MSGCQAKPPSSSTPMQAVAASQATFLGVHNCPSLLFVYALLTIYQVQPRAVSGPLRWLHAGEHVIEQAAHSPKQLLIVNASGITCSCHAAASSSRSSTLSSTLSSSSSSSTSSSSSQARCPCQRHTLTAADWDSFSAMSKQLLYLEVHKMPWAVVPKNVLCKLRHLATLRIIDCSELCGLPQQLDSSSVKLTALQRLEVVNCPSLTAAGSVQQLGEVLKRLKSLKQLRLANTGLDELPDCFASLPQLQHVEIHRCQGLVTAPSSLFHLEKLQWCNVTFRGSAELPAGPYRLPQIEELYLGGNLKQLPEEFGEMPKLRNLRLQVCCHSYGVPRAHYVTLGSSWTGLPQLIEPLLSKRSKAALACSRSAASQWLHCSTQHLAHKALGFLYM